MQIEALFGRARGSGTSSVNAEQCNDAIPVRD
jgi:hypothetical protein